MSRIVVEGHRLEKEGPLSHPGIELKGDLSDCVVKNNVIVGNTWPRTTLQWLLQHPAIRTRSRVIRFRVKRGVWW